MTPLLAALLVACSPLAVQAAGPVAPGAGVLLQQIEQVAPPVPSSTSTGLTIAPQGGTQLPASAPFPVTAIRITGNTLFDTPTLHALVAGDEGKSLTLPALGEVIARITDFYHRHGYPLARAIIPAQSIRGGVVAIEVIEARYDKIGLDNSSRVGDSLLAATLLPLQGGQVIGQTEMDNALLLLSDIPGVVVNATLTPGQQVGTSDLLVNTTPAPAVTGNVALDNNGDRYTGRARLSGTVNFIDPLHHGDVLSVTGLSSGSGLNYGRLAYDTLLNGQGTRIGGSYSTLNYALGNKLASLDAQGTAQVESLWVKQPLMRSRDANVYGQIQYDQMQLRDHIDIASIETDRHLGNWTLSLSGDVRDGLLLGAVSTWSVGVTGGRVDFDNAAAQSADARTVQTHGEFSKWNVNLSRLQSLSTRDSLYLALSGQWANGNLDPSQKMVVGGPYSVRGYDVDAISADTGYLGTAEFRHDLRATWGGLWQAVAFVDSAHVTVNQNTWAAGTNSATLSGAGVGLNWSGPNMWSAKFDLAAPIGSRPELVGSTGSPRAWVALSWGF